MCLHLCSVLSLVSALESGWGLTSLIFVAFCTDLEAFSSSSSSGKRSAILQATSQQNNWQRNCNVQWDKREFKCKRWKLQTLVGPTSSGSVVFPICSRVTGGFFACRQYSQRILGNSHSGNFPDESELDVKIGICESHLCTKHFKYVSNLTDCRNYHKPK